ncbi:MAG: leucine-rich repeat domain-containing protein, partial [Clostridia bacterium]|nr:leucine-rich repeat domain-containing protein [Clostridia bacterium]
QQSEWSVFAGMTELRSLRILSSPVKQPLIKNLPKLEYIELNGCRSVTDISLITDLPNLKEMFINKVDIASPVVHGLPALKKLTMTNADIEYVNMIDDLPSLEYLDLSENDFEALEFSTSLPSLKYLDLSSSRIYVIDDLNIVMNMGSLDLSGNYIKKIGKLSELFTELEYLNLSGNKIKDYSPLNNILIGELVK